MTRPMLGALGALFGVALLACDGPTAPSQRITTGDAEYYASYVQPYLEAGCATLDCHGDPGHPLRLYAELGLRKDDALRATSIAANHEPTALTSEELRDNQLSLAGLTLANHGPGQHLALLKPLALSEGGIAHEGPTLWSSRQEPGFVCLRAYLVDEPSDQPERACAEALDALRSATPSADRR